MKVENMILHSHDTTLHKNFCSKKLPFQNSYISGSHTAKQAKKLYTEPATNSWMMHIIAEVLHSLIIFFSVHNIAECNAITKQTIRSQHSNTTNSI